MKKDKKHIQSFRIGLAFGAVYFVAISAGVGYLYYQHYCKLPQVLTAGELLANIILSILYGSVLAMMWQDFKKMMRDRFIGLTACFQEGDLSPEYLPILIAYGKEHAHRERELFADSNTVAIDAFRAMMQFYGIREGFQRMLEAQKGSIKNPEDLKHLTDTIEYYTYQDEYKKLIGKEMIDWIEGRW